MGLSSQRGYDCQAAETGFFISLVIVKFTVKEMTTETEKNALWL